MEKKQIVYTCRTQKSPSLPLSRICHSAQMKSEASTSIQQNYLYNFLSITFFAQGHRKKWLFPLLVAFAIACRKSSERSVPMLKAQFMPLGECGSLIYFKTSPIQAGTDCTEETSFKMLPLQLLHSCFSVFFSNSSCLLIGTIKRLGKQ